MRKLTAENAKSYAKSAEKIINLKGLCALCENLCGLCVKKS